MSKKYFKDLDDCEKCIIVQMCEDIENRDIVFISTDKRFKVMGKNRSFMSDWTYNLCRWGFARKSRNSDFHAQQHPRWACMRGKRTNDLTAVKISRLYGCSLARADCIGLQSAC